MATKDTHKKPNPSTRKKLLKIFWGTFFAGILSIVLVFLLADWGVFGEMPDFKRLENPESNLASSIYSSDGKVLGKFYFNDNRTPVKYKDLPDHLVNALIATEDERFEEHSGIDMRSTLRAVVYLGKRGGASTITQQLAKLLFHREGAKKTSERSLQKIKEWIIAIRLERQYTKKEILTMYFNEYDFNNGYVQKLLLIQPTPQPPRGHQSPQCSIGSNGQKPLPHYQGKRLLREAPPKAQLPPRRTQ